MLLNILDQIWIQEVYEPHQCELIQALQYEIKRCHDMDRIDEALEKKHVLAKIHRIILATEENQAKKLFLAKVINPSYRQLYMSTKQAFQAVIQESIATVLA